MTQDKNDYMCIFQDTGKKLKLPEFIYTKDFDDIKASCEAKFGGVGKYIRKNDWIDPSSLYGCFIIKLNKGIPVRDEYNNYTKTYFEDDPTKPFAKYHTRSECSKNYKQSAYLTNSIKKPIINLDDFPPSSKEKQSRTNIIVYFYLAIVIVYLIWNLKFSTIRPYYLYDYIEGSVVFRIFLLLFLIGSIILIFCPFKTCWLPRFASKYRKEPLNEMYREFCKVYKEKKKEKYEKNKKNNKNNKNEKNDKNEFDHIGCVIDKTVCTEYDDKFPGCYKDPNYKYMNWVEEYDRLDYQLKDKSENKSSGKELKKNKSKK